MSLTSFLCSTPHHVLFSDLDLNQDGALWGSLTYKVRALTIKLSENHLMPVIFRFVIPVLTYMIPVTKQTFIVTEMRIMFFTHSIGWFLSGRYCIIRNFRLTGMLVYVRINTESTPRISCNKEIPEPHFSLQLIRKPHLKIFPLYSWLVFHYTLILWPGRDLNPYYHLERVVN